VRAISERLRLAKLGESTEDVVRVSDSSPSEFVRLTEAIDEMLDVSLGRHRQIRAAAQERLDVMRSLLPSVVADRVQAGDRGVLDDIDQATIVVATLAGIGPMLAEAGSETGRRTIAEVVSRLDVLAEEHRLEPVKLIGDSYFAGCGLNRPFLDHVARAVAFGLAAVQAVREVDPGGNLSLSVGVATGPVTVGLTGSARLVYDLWGATVNSAVLLARVAGPGQLLVSRSVGDVLPPELDLRRENDVPGIDEPVFAVSIEQKIGVSGDV
jgi:class 3 adenylate cyclase